MSEWFYSCDKATRWLVELAEHLSSKGVLASFPGEGLLRNCVRQCPKCAAEKGIKQCIGWRTVVERGTLVFSPFEVAGRRPVSIMLSADTNVRRPEPAKADEWEDRPAAESVVTVEILDAGSGELLERHHHDLANIGQDGPVWHLQYGGNPAADLEPLRTAWLDPPRWPMAPMDVTLAAEAITYNFFRSEWEALNEDTNWVRLILDAEQLAMMRFAKHMWSHFGIDRGRRDRTWLTAQDNNMSGLHPRP